MEYRLVTEEKRAKYTPELVGQAHVIISDEEKFWVVKHKPGSVDEEKRDLLGYLLGCKFANVAEVKFLNDEDHKQIRVLAGKDDTSLPSNTFLVRLAGSYSLDELPCKTLEQAVATELVYSTWIRRRDAHVDNRVYVRGIPTFFDYQTAFLGEPGLADITAFFGQPTNYGDAGAWRVKTLDSNLTLLTRGVNKTFTGGYHYVHDLDSFKKEIAILKTSFANNLANDWKNSIAQVGFDSPKKEEILGFLEKNLSTLQDDIDRMQQILFQD